MEPLALGHDRPAGNDQLGPGILEVLVSSRTVVPGTVAYLEEGVVALRRHVCDNACRSGM